MKRKRRMLAMLLAAAMCVLPMEFPMVTAVEDVQSEVAEPVLIYDSSPMEVGETRAVRLAIPGTYTAEVTEVSPNILYTYNENSRTFYITATHPGEAELHLTIVDEELQEMTEVVSLTVEGVPMLATDAIPEVTMGIPFPLYNVPLADYQAGKIKVSFWSGSECAELLAEDGADYLQLVGTAPGTVILNFHDANGNALPTSKDAVWRDNPEGIFNIVEDGGTGTRTPHGSYMIRVGQTQQIHFWDAQTMSADSAVIDVVEGEYLISYNYQPGNDYFKVTGRAEGKAVLNIYANAGSDPIEIMPAQVILWVAGENEPTEPMTDPIEPDEPDPVMTTTTIPFYDTFPVETTTTTPDESWRGTNTTMTLPIRETIPKETPYVDPMETTAVSTGIGKATTTTTTTTTTVMTNNTTSSSKETTATSAVGTDELSGDGAWMLDEAFGDLNEDGFVNAQDGADILLDAAEFGASGTHALQGELLDRADTNQDGKVNAIDAGIVLKFSAEYGADPKIPRFPEYIHARLQKPDLDSTHTAEFVQTSAYKAFGLQALEHRLDVITSRAELDAYLAKLCRVTGDASTEYQWLVRDSAEYDEMFFRYQNLLVMTAAEDGHTYQVVHDITADKDNAWTVHVNREIYAQPVGSETPTYIHYMRVNKAIEWANGIAVEFTDVVDPTTSDETPEVPETADVHVFGVRYASVSLPDEPETAVITSPEALEAYLSGVQPWDTYGIGTPADEIAAQYDQYWFRQSSLVIVPVHVSCCDDTCRFLGMTYDAQTDTLDVQAQIIREGVCDALGDWLICIETDAIITDKTTVNVQTEEVAPDDAAFRAAFCHRINGSSLNSREPLVFTDYDTLQAAIKEPSELDFGAHSEPLTSILPRYDGGYFADHGLIVIPIEASSGSYWFNVTDVTMNNNGVTVCIDKFSPEVVTCDMAYWYVFVNVSKPVADAAANGVEVKMTEQALGSIW